MSQISRTLCRGSCFRARAAFCFFCSPQTHVAWSDTCMAATQRRYTGREARGLVGLRTVQHEVAPYTSCFFWATPVVRPPFLPRTSRSGAFADEGTVERGQRGKDVDDGPGVNGRGSAILAQTDTAGRAGRVADAPKALCSGSHGAAGDKQHRRPFPRPPRRAVIGRAARCTSCACQPARCRPVISAPLLSRVASYNPTLAAALSWNRLPARIYFLTMGKLLWPVWAMIARSLTPACAAAVARPARKEWPA